MTLIVVTRESHLISHHIMMTTRPMMKRIKIAPALTVEPSPTSNINIPRSATMLQGCIFLHKIYFIPATRNTIFFSSQMRMNLTWNSFKISRTFNFYGGGGEWIGDPSITADFTLLENVMISQFLFYSPNSIKFQSK